MPAEDPLTGDLMKLCALASETAFLRHYAPGGEKCAAVTADLKAVAARVLEAMEEKPARRGLLDYLSRCRGVRILTFRKVT